MKCDFRNGNEIDVIGAVAHGLTVDKNKTRDMLSLFANNTKFREDILKAEKMRGGAKTLYSVLHNKQYSTKADRTVDYHDMADKVAKEKVRLVNG